MTIHQMKERIKTLEELTTYLRNSEHKLQIDNRILQQDNEILKRTVDGLRNQVAIIHNVTKMYIQ